MFSRAVLRAREAWSSPELHTNTYLPDKLLFKPNTLTYTGSRRRPWTGRTGGSATLAGGNGARATPVPIPNTVVKPRRADGTAWETEWESTSSPALDTQSAPSHVTWGGAFLVAHRGPGGAAARRPPPHKRPAQGHGATATRRADRAQPRFHPGGGNVGLQCFRTPGLGRRIWSSHNDDRTGHPGRTGSPLCSGPQAQPPDVLPESAPRHQALNTDSAGPSVPSYLCASVWADTTVPPCGTAPLCGATRRALLR